MKHAPPPGGSTFDTLCGVDLDDDGVDWDQPEKQRKSPRARGEDVADIGQRVTCTACVGIIDAVHVHFPRGPSSALKGWRGKLGGEALIRKALDGVLDVPKSSVKPSQKSTNASLIAEKKEST